MVSWVEGLLAVELQLSSLQSTHTVFRIIQL